MAAGLAQLLCAGSGNQEVARQLPAFRKQVGDELQGIIDQLPPAVLDEHITDKLGDFQPEWEPPCLLATPRLRKLVFRLLQYKVHAHSITKKSKQPLRAIEI